MSDDSMEDPEEENTVGSSLITKEESLILAVVHDTVDVFKELLNSGLWDRVKGEKRNNLLRISILAESYSAFNSANSIVITNYVQQNFYLFNDFLEKILLLSKYIFYPTLFTTHSFFIIPFFSEYPPILEKIKFEIKFCLNFSKNVFNYLLSLEDSEMDENDERNEKALNLSLSENYNNYSLINEYFALKLIEKGADIHRSNYNFLHKAIGRGYNQVAKLLIEEGVDLNVQDSNYQNQTALQICLLWSSYTAKLEFIPMMLYYGADPYIQNNRKFNAFDVAVQTSNFFDCDVIIYTLFNYMFDKHSENYTIHPKVLLELTHKSTTLFKEVTNYVSKVKKTRTYQTTQIDLFSIKPLNLKILLEKFHSFTYRLLHYAPPDITCTFSMYSITNLNILLNSKLYEATVHFIGGLQLQSVITEMFNNAFLKSTFIEEFISILLTYGLTVTNSDAEIVYKTFGYGSLFKTLLHMDIQRKARQLRRDIVPSIIYDPTVELNTLFDHRYYYYYSEISIVKLLKLFAQPKLKQFAMRLDDAKIICMVSKLPPVPSLVELARDASRKFIVTKFKATSSMKFQTILKWLHIADVQKKIITFERQLYNLE